MKRRFFSILVLLFFLVEIFPISKVTADEPIVCYFGDDFESYPVYGTEMYAKNWDQVLADGKTDSIAMLEKNDGNGFVSLKTRTGLENDKILSSSVYMKKNNIDNGNKSLVYEGLFYTFDKNVKASLVITDTRDTLSLEMLSIIGNELYLRNKTNLLEMVRDDVPVKKWNRIGFVLDGKSDIVQFYLNGEMIKETHVDFKTLDTKKLSIKVLASNYSSVPYVTGNVYVDNFYVYEGIRPVDDTNRIVLNSEIITYLNKQFTSMVSNGRPHGVVSFYSTVKSVEIPSEINKSVEITLGQDGVYFPFEVIAKGLFTSKIIYSSTQDLDIFVRDTKGKRIVIGTLPKKSELGSVKLLFNLNNKSVSMTDDSSLNNKNNLSVNEVAGIGLSGEKAKIVLNKIFAYSGVKEVEDSYFKDYSYTKKALIALVTPSFRNSNYTLSQGIFLGIDFYQASVFGNKIRYHHQPPRVIHGEPYVPVVETVPLFGGEVLDSNNEDGIKLLINNKEVLIGKDMVQTQKNVDYIKASEFAKLFDLQLSWDGSYLLGFGTKVFFNENTDTESLKTALYFQRPTGEEIIDRITKKGNFHPRVMCDAQRLAEVKANIKKNALLRQWYEKLKKDADNYVNAYELYYTKPDGIRLLSVSNLLLQRIEALGIAYYMTGDTKYAEAAWKNLHAVCRFSDWNPSHYLDVGTMSIGVGLGYSWFYDYLTEEQKNIIVEGFKRNGLVPYIQAVDAGEWWTYVNSNWNPWCHGGMLNGIISMIDRLGEEGRYALDRLFPYLEYLYPEFVPDGAWKEGTAYHSVTMRYLSLLCETLETATGKDFGYWDLPGMDVTGYYGDALSGSGGVFNYGDNTETRSDMEAQAWLAKKFQDYGLAQLRYNNIQANSFSTDLYDLIMTRPELLGVHSQMDKDMYYKNMNLFSMRTSWTDASDGIFVAAKGGENGVSHFHYDLGGFVMDIGGVRFAYELGREAYTITQNDVNTYQYKKRAEGHNTYVINPSEDPGQDGAAIAPVIDFQSKERGAFAIIDLTQAYKEARDMKRGFFLTNDRRTLIIQDEVNLIEDCELYWFMHTRGDIEIEEDGKVAYITFKGVTIRCDILDSDNAGAKFEVRPALPLETTPWLEGQGRNENYQKLAIHWKSARHFTLAVAFSQVLDRQVPAYRPEVVPMSEWTIEDGEISPKPTLKAITQDGKLLEGFSPDKYSYTINLPYDTVTAPKFDFYADDNIEVTVIGTDKMVGTTKYLIKDKRNNNYALYTVTTKIQGYIGVIPGTKEAKIINVTASAEPEADAGNVAKNVLDGNFTSRWTATGDAWITLELEEVTELYAVGIAWYSGDSRFYVYEIEVSEDGENWTEVHSGTSSGATTDLECILLRNTKAKYVRYKGHGHLAGEWNNITEMRVYIK